jgi:hypothetical protein
MSKILLKLSSITSFVIAGIYFFIFVVVHLTIPYNYLSANIYDYSWLLIFGLLSLIITFAGILFLHYKDLSSNELLKKKNYILIWSIFLILMAGISGFFGLAAYISLIDKRQFNIKIDYIEEIKELEKLKKDGLITEEEFELKKKKVLDI